MFFNCETCIKRYDNEIDEMNYDTCINGTYFQNISSSNCISKPETRYYIDLYEGKGTLFHCHDNCLACNRGGNDTDHHCLSCIDDLYFDDEIITNCVDDDKECAIGCAKCFKNASHSKYKCVKDAAIKWGIILYKNIPQNNSMYIVILIINLL